MPDTATFDFYETWISNGVRHHYGVDCNCSGENREQCMEDCETSFNTDVVALKGLHPED